MIALTTLIFFMAVAVILGAQRWRGKGTKYLLVGILAVLQTALVLFDMYTMKVPHG